MIPSLISGKGCCKKDYFFEKLNNKSLYPISNLKIDKILKNNKNYIGTYSKDNAPILKNNQSTIINLQNSDKMAHIGFLLKKLVTKYFILIVLLYHFYLILLKINIKIINLLVIFIEFNQLLLINAEDIVFCFLKSNIKNENDYNNFLLKFEKK